MKKLRTDNDDLQVEAGQLRRECRKVTDTIKDLETEHAGIEAKYEATKDVIDNCKVH